MVAEVRFIDGAIASKNSVSIATRPLALGDYDEYSGTRLSGLKDGKWLYKDVDFDVLAACFAQLPITGIYWIGRNGDVRIAAPGGPRLERIPDAGIKGGRFGYLSEARNIGGRVYVCGDSGQIYRRDDAGWVHFDTGPLHRADPFERLGLMSIDGTSEQDIWAVGDKGTIWHFDGVQWLKIAPPSPLHLNAVRCISPGKFYIGGNDGTLIEWGADGWKPIPTPKEIGNVECLEYFHDKLYIGSNGGLFEYDGKKVKLTVTGIKPPPAPLKMDANDGVMWCFSNRHLCFYDGDKWTYVKHPDNPE